MSEAVVLEHLKKIFPSGVVYADLYSRQPMRLTFSVFKLAKASQLGRVDWLASKGYTWKETGYIEPDMRSRNIEAPSYDYDKADERAYKLAHYVFSKFPLAGEYLLNDEEDTLLYHAARNTVQKILKGNTPVTKREEVVLVLETIELLKSWSSSSTEGEGGTFWKYVFLQYGFNPENSEAAEQRLYGRFRTAIKSTLETYKRFFAPEGTQRYYTSLLLHAIAPKQSIDGLFNILFDFYAKNLDFQYVSEDISYKVFTKGMRARWDKRYSNDDSVQLRSDAVFSGLQALFKERPGYMAMLCDSIVKKMDAMLRCKEKDILDPTRNYWDYLLVDWYQRKSTTERVRIQGERRQKKTEYIATSTDRIYVHYVMQNSRVGLILPKIRLASIGDQRPMLTIFQNDICIFEEELSVTGNDLCLTTQSKFVALMDTEYDFSQSPSLRAEISYMGEKIYDSGQKLWRKHLLFDASGNDGRPKVGTAFLFAGGESSVVFSSENGVYQCIHSGQLFQINLGEVETVSVDGEEVFVDEDTASHIRHHASIRRVKGLTILSQGKRVDVYSAPVSFTIILPENDQLLKYQLSLNGERYNIEQLKHSSHEIEVPSTIPDGELHVIRVVNMASDIVRYEYNYAVLKDCQVELDKPLYKAGVDTASLKLMWDGHASDITIPVGEKCSARFTTAGLPYEFEIEIPNVRCSFMGANGFTAPQTLWYRKVRSADFLELEVPTGWTGKVFLGTQEIGTVDRDNMFEVGNVIRATDSTHDEADLILVVTDESKHIENHLITKIVFKPRFTNDPLIIEEEQLFWLPENNFVGDEGSRFEIKLELDHETSKTFEATETATELTSLTDIPNGQHPYSVVLKKKSAFAAGVESEIFRGILTKGNPNEFIFTGKEIILGDCMCWDFGSDSLKQVHMIPGCGILTDLIYQNTSPASGETVKAPCYSGTMYYTTRTGARRPFNAKSTPGFEMVNPVRVWIVNDHLLILRCATDDAVYIDKRFSTIVNKSPETIMSKYEQAERLETPDYFEYKVSEGL